MFETVHGEFYTNSLIHAAYSNDILDVENYILEEEIDINDTDDGGSTALHFAVQHKNKAMVELLLKNKADVNFKDGGGYRPLDYAILNQDQDMIKIILEVGGVLTIKQYDDYSGFRAERLKLAMSKNIEIANMVNKANLNAETRHLAA